MSQKEHSEIEEDEEGQEQPQYVTPEELQAANDAQLERIKELLDSQPKAAAETKPEEDPDPDADPQVVQLQKQVKEMEAQQKQFMANAMHAERERILDQMNIADGETRKRITEFANNQYATGAMPTMAAAVELAHRVVVGTTDTGVKNTQAASIPVPTEKRGTRKGKALTPEQQAQKELDDADAEVWARNKID